MQSHITALANRFREAARPPSNRCIGIEVERPALWADRSLPYSGAQSARTILEGLSRKDARWMAKTNQEGELLGLDGEPGKVSLEPGSQLEFSATPYCNLCQVDRNMMHFEDWVDSLTRDWGVRWIYLGCNPLTPVEGISIIPSERYAIMNTVLGKRGSLSLSMMRLTASIQLNFDYCSEEEAISMLRASLAAAPISYAMFGNSPYYGGKSAGVLSYRGKIWQGTDSARTGLFPAAFEKDFGFDHYAKHLWNYPLMFAQDSGENYFSADGQTLTDLENQTVKLGQRNWQNAIQQMFIEARLKLGYIEVRSIDGLDPETRRGASAFWTGLVYSAEAREYLIEEVASKLGPEGMQELWNQAIHVGLAAKVGKVSALEVARQVLRLSEAQLKARGNCEEKFLDSTRDILERAENPAQKILREMGDTWTWENYRKPS